MTKKTSSFILGIASALLCFNSQAQTAQNLGMPINTQLTSEFNPSISANGKTMILMATTGEDNQEELVITTQKGGIWSRPATVPNLTAKSGKVMGAKDYSLSHDGTKIFYGVNKYGGVGASDIWMMEKKGETWLPPVNMAKPINTAGNEGDPSLSPDGKYLYFVRYSDKKSPSGQPIGTIYVSEKNGNLWKEPVALPAPVTTGGECAPRILSDNRTLYFSSTRKGGKGGLDVYKTQLNDNGTWTTPIAAALINTESDDAYVSVPASGDYIYYTGPSKKGTDLYRIKLSDELKPMKVMLIEGTVTDDASKQPISSKIFVYDVKKNKLENLLYTQPDGKYEVYLREGTDYDFAIQAMDKTHSYVSSLYALSSLEKFIDLKNNVSLKSLSSGTNITLSAVEFDNTQKSLSANSSYEIARIVKLLQDNPSLKAEIAVHTDKVTTDTIPNESLTEIIVDSVLVSDPQDSTGVNKIKIAKYTYHNDNTQKKAEQIRKAVIEKGIPANRVTCKGYGDSQPLANSSNEANKAINRRCELIIR